VTNTSVNPARLDGRRSVRAAGAFGPTMLFWVAPLAGAVIGALIWKSLLSPANLRD